MARWMQILWPSFLVGGIAEGLFFTLFDPVELHFFGQPHELSRIAVYTVGFFAFWLVAAVSSALTSYLRGAGKDNGD